MSWFNPAKIQYLSSRMHRIKTLDMHTGGEPVRIILDGIPEIHGDILTIRKRLMKDYDYYRRCLMWEPRGHYDMYGLLPVKPERRDSDFGVIFMHNAGYSTMCGHATLAVSRCAIDLDWVSSRKDLTIIKIDAPCGQLTSYVEMRDDNIHMISFDNVPSFVLLTQQSVQLKNGMQINYDIAYGGAFYAFVNTKNLPLKIHTRNAQLFKKLAQEIKDCILKESVPINHPFQRDLSFLYGVIFYDDNAKNHPVHSKNVCIFANNELDRSATGSGVSARAALLSYYGELDVGKKITIESIIGSNMQVEIMKHQTYGNFDAIIPRVSGKVFYTGSHEFWIDAADPFKDGFIIP